MSGPPDLQALAEAISARLVALATSPDERAARGELAVLAGKIEAFSAFRGRRQPVRSIAAGMLLALGRLKEAFDLAIESVRRDGRDDLSDEVLGQIRGSVLRTAYDAIEAKRPDLARTELRTMIGFLDGVADTADERAALDLLDRIDGIDATPRDPIATEGRPTLIKLGMWGERFIEAAARSVLACCLAPGNVPALSRHGTVILHLHTRGRDVERVRALEVVRALSRFARIEIAALPEPLFLDAHLWGLGFWNRNILAMAEYDSLMLARQLGADMINLSGDMLLGDGCLGAAKETLAAGHELVLSSALRARTEPMLAAMERYRSGSALGVSGDVLYRLSLEAMHPELLRQFMRRVPQPTVSDPYQFFFPAPDGFTAHAFHWHPLAFSTRSVPADIGFDSHTIDGRFASDLVAGKDRAAACYLQRTPPDDFYLVSLDATSGIESFGAFEVSPRQVVQSMTKWIQRAEDIDHFDWLVRQGVLYRVPSGIGIALPGDCLDEDEAVGEIASGLEARRPELLARIARYARTR